MPSTSYPPAKGYYSSPDKNSIIAHWVSEDRTQQISMVFTKIPATSDPEPVVWTRVTSNGNLPDENTLNLVLRSLLKAGINEIESPNRLWMIPSGDEKSLEFYKAFGGVCPTLHLHVFKNNRIIDALKKIGEPRYFGDALMISGQIDYAVVIAKNGEKTYEPTTVQCNGADAINDPIFDFMATPSEIACKMHYCPTRPVAENDDIRQSDFRVA
jgi:hypothetical protein